MKPIADDLRVVIPEATRQGQAGLWRKRQTMKMQLTEADLKIVLAEGLITSEQAEDVEIVDDYTYPPEVERVLGFRHGRRPDPVRR